MGGDQVTASRTSRILPHHLARIAAECCREDDERSAAVVFGLTREGQIEAYVTFSDEATDVRRPPETLAPPLVVPGPPRGTKRIR